MPLISHINIDESQFLRDFLYLKKWDHNSLWGVYKDYMNIACDCTYCTISHMVGNHMFIEFNPILKPIKFTS